MKKFVIAIGAIIVLFILYTMLVMPDESFDETQNLNIDEALSNSYSEIQEEFGPSETLSENTYQISDQSTVSYTVQKEFFSRPTEPVTGTTDDVFGQVYIDSENQKIFVSAIINPKTLESGSGARDRYVSNQFNSEISIKVQDQDFGSFGQVSLTVPVSLTINGITRIEEFQISGSISESELDLIGSTQIDMTNYSIEPASAANVYTVNEIAEISFDLVATK